jgi:asparagine synthase (glutamine-hydrolysing)
MCGLLGLLAPGTNPNLQAELRLLAHRGPDDEGYYADGDVFLGARRLSIIDLAGGHQPLPNEDQTVWAAQNGEIYNYLDVRAELEAHGHVFRTRSDTEVIAHAYEEWGNDCPKHLRGIFAFAVWEKRCRRLFLARDRFGVKPLYYLDLPHGRLAFASEIRPLLRLLPDSPRANLIALRALFTVGFIPSPRTAFMGIRKLPAAHTLVWEEGRGRVERYWELLPKDGGRRTEDEGRKQNPPSSVLRPPSSVFLDHLRRAVSEQRMSEVPLGALISGGIDSSSIAALLQAQSSEQLHTFTIGFEQAGYDEARYAELAAKRLGTQHHQIIFRESDFERYPEALAHLEEPQCSATALPIFMLYEACRQAGLTVILTGEGADELLGGYHWFQGDAQVQRLLGLPSPIRELIADAPLPISEAGRNVLRSGEREMIARYALWHGVGEANGLFTQELNQVDGLLDDWRETFSASLTGLDAFRQFQYLETHTRLVDFINFEVDRMSMAHSIEARVPFLDHELWEFVASLPSEVLSSPESKKLLRQAMRAYLPPEVIARRKQGLAAPYAAWLRRSRLPEWAEAAFSASALKDTGYFVREVVQKLRTEHQSGQRNYARLLMGVLSVQLWHQYFIKDNY